jgi:hypothetical protein
MPEREKWVVSPLEEVLVCGGGETTGFGISAQAFKAVGDSQLCFNVRPSPP